MRAVEIEGLPAMGVFNVAGQVYVTSNICTHSFAYLTDGYFEGKIVECPLHSGRFDVTTGQATEFPCSEPLRIYEVTIENGEVYVQLPQEEAFTL